MEWLDAIGNCGKTNQEEAKGAFCEDRGEEEDDGAQGKNRQGTSGVGEAPACAQ